MYLSGQLFFKTPNETLKLKKPHFIAMACSYKSYTIIIWCVISKKLNIGKKIKRLEILIVNCENI